MMPMVRNLHQYNPAGDAKTDVAVDLATAALLAVARAASQGLAFVAIALLGVPATAVAEMRSGANSASASIQFRVIIPAMIRVSSVTQPRHIQIDELHVAQGYIDVEAGTSVKLTSNNRNGYLLSARFDTELLSRVEVQISNQNLTAMSGHGSMRVESGRIVDKSLPVSYRLFLAPGVRPGDYRWPVALAFSLANT